MAFFLHTHIMCAIVDYNCILYDICYDICVLSPNAINANCK